MALISATGDRVLFLYVSPSGGHKECANAVRKAFKSATSDRVPTVGIDAITTLYPILGPIIAKAYLEVLKHTPQIWDYLYDNPDVEEISRELRQLFNFLNAPNLKYLLDKFHPNIFVCTHAIPCGVIAEQKKRGNCRLPLAGIITDYDVHSYWVYPEVDLYIVANQESKETLISRGVSEEKIRICGIPVDPAFSDGLDPSEARKKLGLDPSKPVILIMGGARGIGPIREISKAILSLRPSPQVIIVAGTNRDLEKELSLYMKLKNVQIFGYTELIPILMDAADLVITKPGGITSSEALVKGLPMILLNTIPGQEERNARYLVKNGAAIQIQNFKELKEVVRKVLKDRKELKAISLRSRQIATPDAALDSVREILSLLARTPVEERSAGVPSGMMMTDDQDRHVRSVLNPE